MYEKPKLDMVKFAVKADVITTSVSSGGDSNEWTDGGELDGDF